jgi:hypothetical protein
MTPTLLFLLAAMAPLDGPRTSDAVPPPPRRIQRMVVTEFELDEGVSARTARIVVNNLVVELRKLNGFSVIGMDEVRSLLQAETNRQVMGCSEGGSCLAELADALGADVVIAGRIGLLEGSTVFSLRRIDSARAIVSGQVEERLVSQGGEELLAAIGPAVEKLFPEATLHAGEQRGVASEQVRILNPPPLPPAATLTIGGAAVAFGATAGVLALLSTQSLAQGEALLANGANGQPVSGSALAQHESDAGAWATGGLAAGGIGMGLAVAGAVMAAFTDWSNLGEVNP